jgi:hypothetical protein
VVAGIVLLAAALHTYCDIRAPADFDEPIYSTAAYRYSDDIYRDDIRALLSDPFNAERLALTKLIDAGAILTDWRFRGYASLSAREQSHHDRTTYSFQECRTLASYNADARVVTWVFGVHFDFLLALYSPLGDSSARSARSRCAKSSTPTWMRRGSSSRHARFCATCAGARGVQNGCLWSQGSRSDSRSPPDITIRSREW